MRGTRLTVATHGPGWEQPNRGQAGAESGHQWGVQTGPTMVVFEAVLEGH